MSVRMGSATDGAAAGMAELIEEVRPESLREPSLSFAYAYWNSFRGEQALPALERIDTRLLASVPGAFLLLDVIGRGDDFRLRSATPSAPADWSEVRMLARRGVERRAPVQTRIGEKRWVVLPLGDGKGEVSGLLVAVAVCKPAAAASVEPSASSDDRHLQLILDSLDEGVCLVDADGRITHYNKRLAEVLGLPEALLASRPTQDEVIRFQASRGDLDALGVDSEASLEQVTNRVQEATGLIRYERKARDGRIIDVRINPLPDGRQIRTFTEVTARRTAERRLESNEALLSEILANLDAEVAVYDADESFLLGNRRFREKNPHLPPDAELVGKKYADIVRLSIAAGVVQDPRAKKDPETYVARRTVELREAKESSYEHDPESGRWRFIRMHRTPAGLTIRFVFDVSEQKRVEEELAAKTALLELALENMGDGLALYDKDINIVFHNRQMRDFFGFPEELLRGKATAERMAKFLAIRGRYGGGDPSVQIERVLSGFRKRERHMYEHTLPDGRIIEVHHNPLPDGTLIRRYVDVTQRKRMQAEVDAKTALLETTLENMGDGIAVFDRDLNIVLHNRRMREQFGIPESLMRGRTVSAEQVIRAMAAQGHYGPGTPDQHVERLLGSLKSPETGRYEIKEQNGRIVAVHHKPLPDGRLVRRYSDVTAQRRTEAELAAQVKTLQAMLENLDDGIALYDADLKLLIHNRRALDYFDIPEDELKKDPSAAGIIRANAQRGAYGPGDPEAHVTRYLETFKGAEPHEFDWTMFDGTVVKVRNIPVEGGRIIRRYTNVTRSRS
ncbi:MAG: PAS domain-containing protein [Alphaproteobacteria bacterium]|nr:PAS domain-containing protein [Alphaproteobacteria bacterium]